MSEYTAAPSALDRLVRAAPVVALVGLIALAVLPMLQQLPYLVPVSAATPFHVGFGSATGLATMVAALAALIGGVITVERHPARQLIGAGAALVGALWLTHFLVTQASHNAFALWRQLGIF